MSSHFHKLPPLLSQIKNHQDLLDIPDAKLGQLAEEIRETLIQSLSVTGGHLGPNLGVVELSIALHRVFETPTDKILFDVSHQAYIHKLLTGRAEAFHSIRQHEGLSGFMKRSESEHDAFGAGHAGTALSAALGICKARDLKQEDFNVIAVAGDAAFTCGTTLEALNNISQSTKKLITILNDNEWAIDKNVGALAKYFNSLQTSETFSWLRNKTSNFIEKLAGTPVKEFAQNLEGTTKSLLFPSILFHKFGLRYFGPIDGHDIPNLIRTLNYLKTLNEPVILHIITEKGRGYQPALDDPSKFHGLGAYQINDGTTKTSTKPTYSEVFGRTLLSIAKEDPTVVAITAAMPSGTKLEYIKDALPKQYVDVGIAEEHAALFACGMATEGIKPYVAIYSTFMQRCIDMIQHDAALQKLPVKFCMDRAGLSADDGPTHHGLFDIAMLRSIPNLMMMQPKDEAEFVNMIHTMNAWNDGPSAIRYPRGIGLGVALPESPEILPVGKAEVEQEGTDITLVSLGSMISLARETSRALEAEGKSVTIINARFIRPLDSETICRYAKQSQLVCTFEDHSIVGGFGSAVLEALNDAHIQTPSLLIGWPDQFIEHGSESILREKYGLTAPHVIGQINSIIKPNLI